VQLLLKCQELVDVVFGVYTVVSLLPLWATVLWATQNLSGGWVGGERGGRVLKWNSLISRLIRLWMRMQQLNRKEINGAEISTNLLQP
jgi:hypothetical protein